MKIRKIDKNLNTIDVTYQTGLTNVAQSEHCVNLQNEKPDLIWIEKIWCMLLISLKMSSMKKMRQSYSKTIL